MITKTVAAVRVGVVQDQGGQSEPVWFIDFSHPDGTLHGYGFPQSTLMQRAAEYGIDPSNVDTLLDVVLHEPYMSLQHTDPSFLWNTDQATARTAHLERVAALKQRLTIADPQGLLQQIRDHYMTTFDPAEHGRRVQAVAAIRRGNHAPHFQLIRNRPAL